MDLIKPQRFDCDHTAATAGEEWTYWKKTLENFTKRAEKKAAAANPPEEVDKPEILTSFISANIFKHITECKSYESAIIILTALYIKPRNEIFARHQLATRKQQQGESIDEYLQALRILSKEAKFEAVSAEQNASDYIRDAFINGISSQLIRTRLLENTTLTLDAAFTQARALDLAQKHSETYRNQPFGASISAASAHQQPHSYEKSVVNGFHEQNPVVAAGSYHRDRPQQCFFCGGARHPRRECPARDKYCKKCGTKGHFQQVCRSSGPRSSNMNAAIFAESPSSANFQQPFINPTLYSLSSFNPKVLTMSTVDSIPAKTLADTGANITCADSAFIKKNKFRVIKSPQQVNLASDHKVIASGYIIANLVFKGHTYKSIPICVLPNLVAEVIIGTELMEQHESVKINFGGERPPLVLSALNPINVTAPTLFANLTPDCHPIAVKSRRYSSEDQMFIKTEIDRLLENGIIEASNSPWRAQVLVHRSENHKTRLVVDYSRTINQFTELDAYPVPRVDEVIGTMSKYSVFSEEDLLSAYHQIVLPEEDKKYTAFQACGRLFQFTRIPFGLRNSGAVFQRILDTIVEEDKLEGVALYCDNIYIGGRDQAEHDQNLARFHEVAARKNITFNKGKSVYSTDTLSILGTQISGGSTRPDPERVKALMELPVPSNMVELKCQVGMFAHYSQWLPQFSKHIQPLVKNESFPISKEAIDSLNKL